MPEPPGLTARKEPMQEVAPMGGTPGLCLHPGSLRGQQALPGEVWAQHG